MNIANFLTLLRICISPLFLLFYVEHDRFDISTTALPYLLLGLWSVSELSDAFDGYLARRYNQVTNFGKILDPMADNISHIAMLLAFTQPPVHLHPLLLFAFLYRESMVSALRTICALKGVALAARTSGKIKAILQALSVLTIIVLMIPHSLGQLSGFTLHWISSAIIAATALYALISGAEYIYANRLYVKRILSKV